MAPLITVYRPVNTSLHSQHGSIYISVMPVLLFCLSGSPSDVIRTIRDPEKPNTLEELDVVSEKCVQVQELGEDEYLIVIRFSPTVPHCSLATLIGMDVPPSGASFTLGIGVTG